MIPAKTALAMCYCKTINLNIMLLNRVTAEINYGQVEKEFLGTLSACKTFYSFIYGIETVMYRSHATYFVNEKRNN